MRSRSHLEQAGLGCWRLFPLLNTQFMRGFSVLVRAMSWLVFVGSWLLDPRANPSPWLDAETEKKQDPGTGERAPGRVCVWAMLCPRVGSTSMDTETTQALHTIGVACSGDLGGEHHISVSGTLFCLQFFGRESSFLNLTPKGSQSGTNINAGRQAKLPQTGYRSG